MRSVICSRCGISRVSLYNRISVGLSVCGPDPTAAVLKIETKTSVNYYILSRIRGFLRRGKKYSKASLQANL